MNKYTKYVLAAIVISAIGFVIYFFGLKANNHSVMTQQTEVYICPMPEDSVFSDKPGSCQKCGMTLEKKVMESTNIEDNSIDNLLKPTDKFIVGNYQTTVAKDTVIYSEINLPGVVEYDPNSSVNIAARISGRIERMYVNYKFQKISKGQKMFDLYSPELLTEQQNFIYLISNDTNNSSIIKASKQKLLLYGMTENQINLLFSTQRANPIISIYSPASGIIQGTENRPISINGSMTNTYLTTENLSVKEGDYIKKNEPVFKLLNTEKVWCIFNVSQAYSSVTTINQSINITTEVDKNKTLHAKINFVETQLNSVDKSNRIRVYLNNSQLKLPIGLRLEGVLKTSPTKGIWIQKESMVSIGTKKIIFLKLENGFKASAIKTGVELGNFVQVIGGISVEDSIAKNAHYLIDSESFIKTE
ncbi:efflux RND transporter periplasmic adaptor subunit [uncultured Flavobacterium sp.]|uniref:efflux RND transporter periplasmic adaptor subunit n=1 Tax=uncultured Flavobacterium sp. TaxID=165435 RepID=UPI0030CA25B8